MKSSTEEENKFIEELAELEHKQWMEWSKNIAKKEKLSSGRTTRWKDLWISYSDLPEDVKEQDRVWARKVLACIVGELMYIGYIHTVDEEEMLVIPKKKLKELVEK